MPVGKGYGDGRPGPRKEFDIEMDIGNENDENEDTGEVVMAQTEMWMETQMETGTGRR
jgi:hypothetical protein